VALYEVGEIVPVVNVNGVAATTKTSVHFESEGPHISSVAGLTSEGVISYTAADLDAKNKITIAFKLTDRDSTNDEIEVTGKSSTKFVTAVAFGEADGEVHTLVLTFDPDFDGDAEAIITLTATDQHDRVLIKAFKVEIKLGYSAFWATMASDCDVDSMSGSYVIGGKDAGTKWTVDSTKFASMGAFQVGSAIDVSTGLYTVPQNGLYMVAANIRIDKVSPEGW
jgi:hypothetical protein